jgi:hypothetical protein
VDRYGSRDVDADYPLLRALLMGAVFAVLLPGVPMAPARLRAELFQRYGLDWELGVPPGGQPPGGTAVGPGQSSSKSSSKSSK